MTAWPGQEVTPTTRRGTFIPNPADARAEQAAANDAVRTDIAVSEAEAKARERASGFDATEGERKAAAFLIRALGANQSYEAQDIGPRNMVGQFFKDNFPNLLNTLPAAIGNSDARQVADSAQDEFIAASLRQDSGAAIPPEELERQRRIYFPMPGDNEDAIAAKAEARRRAVEGLRQSSGRLLGQTEERWNAMQGARQPDMVGRIPRGSEIEFNVDRWGKDGFDRNAALLDIYGVTPNQEAAISAFWNANRGNSSLTPDAVKSFYRGLGLPSVPSDDAIAQAIDSAKQGASFTGYDTSAAEQAWRQRLETEAARRGQMGAIDLAGQGLQAGLGDEAAGAGGAISALLTGGDPAEGYRFENDLRDLQLEQARAASGAAGVGAELLGNAASLGIATRIPSTARAAVREGAAAGAVPGFGYGEGADESLVGAGLGAAGGAALGRLFAPRGPRPPTPGGQVMQAADDLNAQFGTNIRPLPADVGGPMTRRATGAAAQMPLGASPIIRAGQAVTTEGEAARNAIAALVAAPREIESAGQQALSGAQKWLKTSGTRVNSLYTRARNASEGVAVPLTNARRVLDEQIAELEATPGGAPGVADLKALRDEISGGYTVDAIKRMRTTLRDRFMGDGIRRSDIERRVGTIIDAAEQDVADGLIAAGRPEAAQAWTKAAAAARDRIQTIDNVLAPVIGRRGDAPRSGEQIMDAIGRMAKGDNAKLARFVAALPRDEAASVRANVIGRLGTTNADASDFSLARFLAQWEKMTPGAKRTLFGGELTEALDKLGTVAGGAKEAQRFANFSNTGSTMGMLATGGLGVSAFSNPVLAIGGLAAQYGLGRLLASPGFARWLSRVRKNPQAAQRHVEGLSRIAAAESAIAADALGLQRQLAAAFDQGALPLAAQPSDSRETGAAAR